VIFDPAYTSLVPGKFFKWPNNPDKKQYSFTCDENHPCTWALSIVNRPPNGAPWVSVVDQSIKFRAAAPGIKIQGCGGIDNSTFNASVPERFAQTLVGWNQLLCAPTRAAQPTNIVSETEDAALASFNTGTSDIAVTGSGNALATQNVRARAYVPVGLNAAVVAAVGWSATDRADDGSPLTAKVTDNLRFSWDDLANMLSKGGVLPTDSGRGGIFHDDSALVQRNAALASIHNYEGAPRGPEKRSGGYDPISGFLGVTGEAGKGSVPLLMSSTIAQHAPNSWVYGNFTDRNGPVAGSGKPVGTVTDLNDLNLGAVLNVHNADAKTGQINIRKQVNDVTIGTGNDCIGGCLNWVVTDLATATKYGWTPVALPDGRGGYVAPTAPSLQAAATHFKQAADGSLQPGDSSGDPRAYPLTFAESIAAPVNPLVDANCQPDKAKQDRLTTLLRAATNGGQLAMGAGLVPLTPELLGAAQDAAAKVGAGVSAASCTEKGTAAGNPPPAAGNPPPAASTPSFPGSPLPGQTPNAGDPPKASPPATVVDAQKVAESVRIPVFPGAGPLGELGPLLALVVLVILPSATAYLMAGRPAPPWLTRILRRVANGLARLATRVRRPRFLPAGGGA
jgi:hypothetical protein